MFIRVNLFERQQIEQTNSKPQEKSKKSASVKILVNMLLKKQ